MMTERGGEFLGSIYQEKRFVYEISSIFICVMCAYALYRDANVYMYRKREKRRVSGTETEMEMSCR